MDGGYGKSQKVTPVVTAQHEKIKKWLGRVGPQHSKDGQEVARFSGGFGYWMTLTGAQWTPITGSPVRRFFWKADIYHMSRPLFDCNHVVRSYDKNEAVPICKYNGWIYQLIDFYGASGGMKAWTIWTDWAGSDVLTSLPRAIVAYNHHGNDARNELPAEVQSQQKLWDKNRNDPVWARAQRESQLETRQHQFPELLTTGECLRFEWTLKDALFQHSRKMCELTFNPTDGSVAPVAKVPPVAYEYWSPPWVA